jgi:hypothetical protein
MAPFAGFAGPLVPDDFIFIATTLDLFEPIPEHFPRI